MFDRELFLEILDRLADAGALDSLCLIGSWAQLVYQANLDPTIPAARTTDLDFLIARKLPMPTSPIDLPGLLEEMGFHCDIAYGSNVEKYRREDLDVEFLCSVRRGESPKSFPALGIKAHYLGRIEYIEERIVRMAYEQHSLNVPHPAAFGWHKLFVSTRRKDSAKGLKDREAGYDVLMGATNHYGQSVVDRFLEEMPGRMRVLAQRVFEQMREEREG